MDVKTAETYTYELEPLPRIGGTSMNPTTAAPSRVASTDALDSEQQREEDAVAPPHLDGRKCDETFEREKGAPPFVTIHSGRCE